MFSFFLGLPDPTSAEILLLLPLPPCRWMEQMFSSSLGPAKTFPAKTVKVKSLSHVQLFATPWTVAYQAPPSMGFSGQEYWSGLPFPSPGDLPDPGIESGTPAFQAEALTSEPPGKPYRKVTSTRKPSQTHSPSFSHSVLSLPPESTDVWIPG